ncbi:MAG: ABC transporter ATP-binding protein [Ignavibacteriae bacterium]|nr:ABC transporter ATP-binding protein [Ignavibacteriota bacterium]
MIMNFLELLNIDFKYEKNSPYTFFSISELNLKVNAGEFITVLGPNGSGKSTLLKLIANLLIPNNGQIFLDNKNYNKYERKEFAKIVSFVPQINKMFFQFSVYEIVMMGRTPYQNIFGIENEIDKEKVNNVLELLEIDHIKNKGINEVSGGEAQRALIARALIQDPKIILLDEPNAHLDIKHQVAIFNILKKLNDEFKLTVMLISHELNLASHFSKRILLMNKGKIEFDAKPNEVLTEQNIKSIFKINSSISINEKEEIFIKIIPKL